MMVSFEYLFILDAILSKGFIAFKRFYCFLNLFFASWVI